MHAAASRTPHYAVPIARNAMDVASIILAASPCWRLSHRNGFAAARPHLRAGAPAGAAEAEAEALADRLFAETEQSERRRQLIESQIDLVVSRDLDGRITHVNDAYAHVRQPVRRGAAGNRIPLRDRSRRNATPNATAMAGTSSAS